MYRSAMKRVLVYPSYYGNKLSSIAPPLLPRITSSFISTTTTKQSDLPSPPPHPLSHQNPSPFQHPPPSQTPPETATSSSAAEEKPKSSIDDEQKHRRRSGYQDEQIALLQAALPHVISLGWTEAALISGAKAVGVSPSIIGSFPRKEATLVEFFMDECLQKLIDRIDSDDELKNLIPSDCIAKLVRIRLEMQAPYISKWPQALSIQALPQNIPTSFKQRAMLVDEIWHAAGDQASDIDWYMKRTILGGVYSATEVYMLTDNSPDFRDTWAFLNNRVKDGFDIGKTVKEATYLAEAVGAGIGNTFQGFVKGMSRG